MLSLAHPAVYTPIPLVRPLPLTYLSYRSAVYCMMHGIAQLMCLFHSYYGCMVGNLWASKLVERRLCSAWRTLQCIRPFRWCAAQRQLILGCSEL